MEQVQMKKIFLSIFSTVFSFSGSLLLMIVLAALSIAYGKMEINLHTQEVNGMLWQAGNSKFNVHLKSIPLEPKEDQEGQRQLLTIYDSENKTVFNKQLYINWDMFGAGFVKAMQVDADPELEIVFYSPSKVNAFIDRKHYFYDDTHPTINFSFYLDINPKTGKIEIKNFDTQASAEARELAKSILSTIKPLLLVMFILFGAPFIAIVLGLLGKLGRHIFSSDKQAD